VSPKVTSIQLTADVFAKGPHAGSFAFLCGTTKCDMFYVRYLAKDNKMVAELEQTNHNEPIVDIAFPQGYGALFATASGDNIRVWHATEYRELLRIQVCDSQPTQPTTQGRCLASQPGRLAASAEPGSGGWVVVWQYPNLKVNCIFFMADGKSLVTGWSDGKIRAFGPQSGRLLYTIPNAHQLGVTAIIGSNDCTKLISGGREGQVREWCPPARSPTAMWVGLGFTTT
jgi:WD40 repeat protein